MARVIFQKPETGLHLEKEANRDLPKEVFKKSKRVYRKWSSLVFWVHLSSFL